MHFLKVEIDQVNQIRASKRAKTAVLGLLHSPKLVSRKIWMPEKLRISTICAQTLRKICVAENILNFHTVKFIQFTLKNYVKWIKHSVLTLTFSSSGLSIFSKYFKTVSVALRPLLLATEDWKRKKNNREIDFSVKFISQFLENAKK